MFLSFARRLCGLSINDAGKQHSRRSSSSTSVAGMAHVAHVAPPAQAAPAAPAKDDEDPGEGKGDDKEPAVLHRGTGAGGRREDGAGERGVIISLLRQPPSLKSQPRVVLPCLSLRTHAAHAHTGHTKARFRPAVQRPRAPTWMAQ